MLGQDKHWKDLHALKLILIIPYYIYESKEYTKFKNYFFKLDSRNGLDTMVCNLGWME